MSGLVGILMMAVVGLLFGVGFWFAARLVGRRGA